jgi:DNA-binding beta-propeller fold protein YncE
LLLRNFHECTMRNKLCAHVLSASLGTLIILSHGFIAPARADLLAGDFKFNSVFRFNDETGAEVPGGIAAGSAGLEATAGVAVGPDGNIYVSSQNTGEILFYDGETGAPLSSPLPGGRDGLFALLRTEDHPGGAPGPLRFGPDGNLYVSDFGGTTVRVFHGMTGVELPPAASGFGPPGGLAFAPNGDLYVGNFGTSAIIRVRNGAQQTFIASGTGPILTPSAMLLVPNGDMLVVSMFANEIHRYSASGAYLGLFAAIEPVPPPVDVTNYPSDIAFDADGNIVVAVLGATNPPDNRGQILRFALNEGSVAGTLLDTLVDAYPPMGSIAWIRSPDAITGDFNNDGTVNSADLNKWRADYGKWVAKGGGADASGNGIVDSADYVVWRKAFGSGPPAGAANAVPEPGIAISALVTAMIIGSTWRMRFR